MTKPEAWPPHPPPQVLWQQQALVVGALRRPPAGSAGPGGRAGGRGSGPQRGRLRLNHELMENKGLRDALLHLRSAHGRTTRKP